MNVYADRRQPQLKAPFVNTENLFKQRGESSIAKNETEDCVVRAIASAFGARYDAAWTWTSHMLGRERRRGVYQEVLFQVMDNFVEQGEVKLFGRRYRIELVEPFTYYRNKEQMVQRRMTVSTLLKKKGTFFVVIKGHAFTIKDGTVMGNWEDAGRLRRRLVKVYRVHPL